MPPLLPGQMSSSRIKTKIRSDDVKRAEELFREARGAKSKWAKQAYENRLLASNVAYSAEEVASFDASNIPTMATPLLHQMESQYVSMLAADEPEFVALPREDTDVDIAALKSRQMSYIWQGAGQPSDHNQVKLIQVCKDEFTEGVGLFQVYVDPESSQELGDIRIRTIDQLNWYPDPYSRDPLCQDAAFQIISYLVTEEQAIRALGNAAKRVFDPRRKPENQPQREESDDKPRGRAVPTEGQQFEGDSTILHIDRYRLIELFERIEHTYWMVEEEIGRAFPRTMVLDEDGYEAYQAQRAYAIGDQSGFNKFAITDQEVEYFDGIFAASTSDGNIAIVPVPTPNGDIQETFLLRTTRGALINADVIKAREFTERRIRVIQVLGRQFAQELNLKTALYPNIPYMSQHRGTPYPTALATQIRPNIDEFNKLSQIIVAWSHSMAGWKLMGPDSAITRDGLKELTKVGPGYVTTREGLEPHEVPQPLVLGQLPNHIPDEKERILGRIYTAVSLYPENAGAPTGLHNEPFRGQVVRDQQAQRNIKINGDYLGLTLTTVAKVVDDLGRDVYTQPRLLRIHNPSNPRSEVFEAVNINTPIYDDFGRVIDIANDVTVSQVDLVFVAGSTLPTNRQAERESYQLIYQFLATVNPGAANAFLPHLLKKYDIIGWEEIVAAGDMNRQLQEALAAAQKEIERLQGDKQTADRELRTADRQVSKAKFDERLSSILSKVESEGSLTRQRMRDAERQRSASPLMDRLEEAMNLFSQPRQTEGKA